MKWTHRAVIFVTLFLTSSCDIGNIQDQNYATAIGIDYKNGQYQVFIQMLSFNAVAKKEGGATGEEAKMVISKTEGETLINALFKAYQTAQQRIVWAHVTAIVISESAMEEGLDNIYDGLTRYYEFRPTPWVFGTRDSMEDILSTPGFFGQSSLETLLHNPTETFQQSSIIRPAKLNKIGRELFEPARTTYIPSLSLNKDQWKTNKKDEPKLTFNGAFFLRSEEYQDFFSLEEIKGLRWLENESVRLEFLVPSQKNPDFIAVIEDQVINIETEKINENYEFKLTFLGKGLISNRLKNNILHVKSMHREAGEVILAEIRELYLLGVERNIDFLNLEHELYRKHNKDWQRLEKKNANILTKSAISEYNATIILEHSGSFKNDKINIRKIN